MLLDVLALQRRCSFNGHEIRVQKTSFIHRMQYGLAIDGLKQDQVDAVAAVKADMESERNPLTATSLADPHLNFHIRIGWLLTDQAPITSRHPPPNSDLFRSKSAALSLQLFREKDKKTPDAVYGVWSGLGRMGY